ncbi:SH3 domain-containing protein [Pseudooceanicola sp. C21-150M6]|uniref:SH3 domain-containing protein n=1 Tax=Pseudooceanicola sp. C21-150M6 TaxID=3434355 RepID=UPI003D7F1FA8
MTRPETTAAPEVTRASFSSLEVSPREPDETELAAVDPAVLAAFATPPQPAPTAENAFTDIREVTGNRVNMRNGPGTNYAIVDRLTRGQEVEVLSEPGNGWLELRVNDTGQVGWMADFLVTASSE